MTETINFGENTDEKAAPEGHDQKMAEVFDKAADTAPEPLPSEDRPAWLPEKFKSPEDLAKAYDELSRKLGTAPKDEGSKEKSALNIDADTDAAKEAMTNVGLDFNEFSSEFAKNGALSDESYERLTKAGIPREMVDSYIEGQVARADAVRYQVLAEVGGEDNFTAMSAWAAKSLSPSELAAYNAAVDSPDLEAKKLAVKGLYAKYAAVNGSEPSLITGASTYASGDSFRSVAELTTAMKDPRYQSDPAYRDDVIRKLSRSDIL